jgi:hypothetical protein
MRSLAITVLLLSACGAISVGRQNPSLPKEPQGKSDNQAVQPKPAVAPPELVTNTPVSPATQTETRTSQLEVKPFLSHGEYVMGVLTTIYVLISFFSFMAIKRQADIGADSAVAAKNAASAAQDAARAAEKNTEALMNIERPWLIVTGVKYETFPTADGNQPHVVITFKNFGHSIASPVRVGGTFRVFENAGDLPEEPTYHDITQIKELGVLMPADDERPLLRLRLETDASDFHKVIHGPLIWYAFGFVTYEDIFGRIHETRFCYATASSGAAIFWPRPGPPKYNLHT